MVSGDPGVKFEFLTILAPANHMSIKAKGGMVKTKNLPQSFFILVKVRVSQGIQRVVDVFFVPRKKHSSRKVK